MRARGAALPAVIAALSLAACGSGTSKTTSTTPTTTSAPRPVARTTLAVGQAYSVSNTGGSTAVLAVTVTKVIDPLTGTGAALAPGTRAVGVKLDILNHGPSDYDSSATGDVSLVLSSGAAVPAFAPSGTCQTPVRDFDNHIGPGEHHDGCVVFAVPTGAKVNGVRFAPHGNRAVPYIWSVR